MMLKLVVLIVSLEAIIAEEDSYCDKSDLRYLFAKVHNMEKQVNKLNTKLEELNSTFDETIVNLNSSMEDIREQVHDMGKQVKKLTTKLEELNVTLNSGMDDIRKQLNNITTSTDINECASGPCRNDGICADIVNGYNCTCQKGYTGINCENDINECASGPCRNDGRCADNVNGYNCTCQKGYEGSDCETDINECTSGPCKNDGICTDKVNGYNCTCHEGYTGINCETDINECASGPCRNGGECADKVNGYTCNCQNGFTGIDCETAICKNGWVHFNRSCYLFVDSRNSRRNWNDAQENCRSSSSDLVIIKSAEENNFLKQQLANRNPDEEDQYWTAGNDRQAENQWVWGNTGDRVEVSFWHPGEPNQKNKYEDCLTFYTRFNFDWNDEDCRKEMPYICEVEY